MRDDHDGPDHHHDGGRGGGGGGGRRRRRGRRRRGGGGHHGGHDRGPYPDPGPDDGEPVGEDAAPFDGGPVEEGSGDWATDPLGADPGDDHASGLLVVAKDGFGFLRQPRNNYLTGPGDVFVPQGMIQRWRLRAGQFIEGRLGEGRRGRRKRPLEVVDRVDGDPPEVAARRPHWKSLASTDPVRRILLETRANDPTLRAVDLAAPLGFGQRMLLVAPPRTGKTVILHKLAGAITENHPDAHILVTLVDERPEEVTDFRRTCTNAEVVATSLDMDPAAHVAVVEVVLERVKRLAEAGRDVVCIIDSLTRIARAFNTERGRSGRTLAGGMDSMALQRPRDFFGAARSFEGRGSLTTIATVSVDTGSRLDQVIFEEFKGTGNSELVLDRELAERRIFPAINFKDSGTRKEEKLRDPHEMQLVNQLRRGLVRYPTLRAMEQLLSRLKTTQNNPELLLQLQRQAI